ncbi:cytochrome c oxidase assembly protein [Mangrovicella endophytica]|uniref:cytochrome c oxidase assembly protein n=1 Tax=Mangrovicella endophytica TaxID=2066697 RepID=UPI000C9EC375|nr:cytochrome c oxidase assembly protein [Mangrovicella endophytica]
MHASHLALGYFHPSGLAAHMLQHIIMMNVVAPLLALGVRRWLPSTTWRIWPAATAAQLLLLWGWHAPAVFESAMGSPALWLLMHGTLLVAALCFWSAIISASGTRSWRAIFALLITGKLFCLLGALLTFAPRTILAAGPEGAPIDAAAALADQQLAGLIMIVACPLSYVLAGIIVSARWFLALEGEAPDANPRYS